MKDRRGALSDILKDKDFSEFEKRVYRAVCRIPSGEVRTYKWVAKEALAPGACRAVGNALNKNPYPGEIPCHRVIKSDGSIGGYAKGSAMKARLLRREAIDGNGKHCYNPV
ncbi:MAG: MGMT family protein [Candidatus Omnitrophota bacterium]